MAIKIDSSDSMDRFELVIDDEGNMVWGPEADKFRTKNLGRPPIVDELSLLRRRDDLLQLIEEQWADFAWDLRRVRSISGLRKAHESLRKHREFELFVDESAQITTARSLKQSRDERDRLLQRSRIAFEDEKNEKDHLESALRAHKDSAHDERLRAICDERRQNHAVALELLRQYQSLLEDVRSGLHRREAYFSQSELLDFLVSQRFVLNPLTLANAIAGLPRIGWRRSMERCAKSNPRITGSIFYRIFLELKRALASPPRTANLAIDQVKTYLVRNINKSDPVLRKLRDEFYYIRVSIEAAYLQEHPRGAIPFRVSAEYRRRSSSQTPYDQVMEMEERI